MTVQGMQHVVQENLRSVMGLLQSRDEGLPEVVYDGIKCSLWPHKVFHLRRLMSMGNFVQSSLSDKQDQCVEGIWEQNCRFVL